MSTFAHNEQQNTFLMDPVHIYIYVCVYIYIYVARPQWGAVQLLEGGDTGRQFRRNPGGREQSHGSWSCHLMWPLLPQTEEAAAQATGCPNFGYRGCGPA